MVTMQMSIENTFSVVRLTLFRLHTRPRRPYKARFALQFFCVGVANNLYAFFSQCPRTLPAVVSCTWYITLMSHPSCNRSDLLHSGMRFIFAYQSSPSWQICRVCTPLLLSSANYLFAGTRRLNAAFRTTLLGCYTAKSCIMSCLTLTRRFRLCTLFASRVRSRYLQRLCVSGFTYAGNELIFSNLTAEAVALFLLCL